MKKFLSRILTGILMLVSIITFTACGSVEKNITVVVREQGSGTREAVDKVVTDGTHVLEERDADGKKVYNTTKTAIQQTKTGTVLSSVASDKNAIGYISLGSVGDSIRVVKVNGVDPTEETVLNGDYQIQRPFVIMTKAGLTLTDRTDDFMQYLKSEASKDYAEAAGCIFLADAGKRANAGAVPIAVVTYQKRDTLPAGDKIVIRGSTSVEKFINAAAKGYADLYGVNAETVFDIQLEGSSVGRKAVEEDTKGNVIGFSSAAVEQENIDSFNVCLDAVVVIVNQNNTQVTDLTLAQLYDIFSGKITKFSELQ